MKVMMKLILFVLTILMGVHSSEGGILSNVFGSNMVLQRSPSSASLYGWSSRGDTITVNFDNAKKYQKVAGSDGAWSVSLDPMKEGGPYTIVILSSANASATVTLDNVLFGDVILCGGQSNMQFSVIAVFNASEELQAANKYPNIRLFTVGQNTVSATPLNELRTIEQRWSVANNVTVGAEQQAFGYFSAICWFTAVNILSTFPSLPIGLVSSNWGGTMIQSWASPDALNLCPQSNATTTTHKLAASPHLYTHSSEEEMVTSGSSLWNAMIVPFLQMRLSAFLWHQASANVGETDLYRCLFPAMINDWRAKWGIGDTPFFFVQLGPYTTDGPLPFWYSLADMRLAQESGLRLPNVAMISTIDADIHPRNKQIVGFRMSLAILHILYGRFEVIYSGPSISSATIATELPNVSVMVNFLPTTIGAGLELVSPSCPANYSSYCSTWEIGLSDGTWHVGAAKVVNNVAISLSLASPVNSIRGVNVSAVRYLYSDWPAPSLYSKSGLPANPFYFTFIQ